MTTRSGRVHVREGRIVGNAEKLDEFGRQHATLIGLLRKRVRVRRKRRHMQLPVSLVDHEALLATFAVRRRGSAVLRSKPSPQITFESNTDRGSRAENRGARGESLITRHTQPSPLCQILLLQLYDQSTGAELQPGALRNRT